MAENTGTPRKLIYSVKITTKDGTIRYFKDYILEQKRWNEQGIEIPQKRTILYTTDIAKCMKFKGALEYTKEYTMDGVVQRIKADLDANHEEYEPEGIEIIEFDQF
jgi:hypothetical protein